MSGIDPQEAKEHFILRLRDTELAKDRWCKILKAILAGTADRHLSDGMLDIVEDYNDQVEASQ